MLVGEFCPGPFWDTNLTWYTDQPDFTSCFHKTFLIYFPCSILWILTPLELWLNERNKKGDISWSRVNLLKLAQDALLVATSVAKLAFVVWISTFEDYEVTLEGLIGTISLTVTFCLDFALMVLAKRSGKCPLKRIQNQSIQKIDIAAYFFLIFATAIVDFYWTKHVKETPPLNEEIMHLEAW